MDTETGTARPPGMADVAARAGVSHQTVSRVINHHPSVAPLTRERVQQAIAELGYRPNAAARALVTGSTRTIGLVTVNPNQFGPAQTMVGLERAARDAGYGLSVTILDEATADEMRDAVGTFVSHSVSAIVALSTYDAPAEALGILEAPVPLVAVQVGCAEDRPAVGVDQVTGARLATRHLLELGHRTVHHVTGPADSTEARSRIDGWRAELAAAGAVPPETVAGDWTPESGYAAGRALLDRMRDGEEITAVFVANDQMALGLLAALHEAGLGIPDEMSVVGFDDLPESRYLAPPLTTVRQDFSELGRRGVQLVLDRLAGHNPHLEPVMPTLEVRASTAPPPPVLPSEGAAIVSTSTVEAGTGVEAAIAAVRAEVATLHGELARSGLVVWTAGNVSGRVPGADLFVIKPSGVGYDELTPENMVLCDLDGAVVPGSPGSDRSPSSDTAAHAYVYRHMPEVGGVVHTHSTFAVAWAARGEEIPCVITAMADEFGGPIPVGPFAVIGDDSIGRGIVETLTGHRSRAVLMQSHGPFTIGTSPKDAVKAAVMLEDVARTVHHARTGGPLLPIPQDAIDQLYDRYQNAYGQPQDDRR